jgi:hypothetical protein
VAKENNIDWSEYFASIVSVCPWSKSYWKKQKIDIQTWKGTKHITPLGEYVARMWIHKNASGRTLCNIHHRLNDCRTHEEWLFSHPCYGGHSTPIPVLIQQDLVSLTQARMSKNKER